jgi:hypothetical protein
LNGGRREASDVMVCPGFSAFYHAAGLGIIKPLR